MTHKLTDLGIAILIVPTTLRWPTSEVAAWGRLRDGVDALRDMLRALDNACQRVERDHRLQPQEVRRHRTELGERALRQLADFKPVLTAERAINENFDKLEPKMQTLLMKALGELREGVDAARRAVVERCQMRVFAS